MRVLPVMVGSGRGQGQKHALPEVSVTGGQGETKADTESGTEEEKGGEEMTREEVVQAALTVERWCAEHRKIKGVCDCPFYKHDRVDCVMGDLSKPSGLGLERFLRTRGLKDGSV